MSDNVSVTCDTVNKVWHHKDILQPVSLTRGHSTDLMCHLQCAASRGRVTVEVMHRLCYYLRCNHACTIICTSSGLVHDYGGVRRSNHVTGSSAIGELIQQYLHCRCSFTLFSISYSWCHAGPGVYIQALLKLKPLCCCFCSVEMLKTQCL